MKKLIVALMLAMMIILVLAGPALAAPRYDGPPGVSATGYGPCNMDTMGPGTGKPVVMWLPEAAYENINRGVVSFWVGTPSLLNP